MGQSRSAHVQISYLSVETLYEAEKAIVSYVQQEHCKEEMQILENAADGKPFRMSSCRMLGSLILF